MSYVKQKEKLIAPANGRSLPAQTRFNNPNVVVQSWYVAARSADVRPGQVKSFNLLNRRITLFRDEKRASHAVDARCPHLGADLGHGRMNGDEFGGHMKLTLIHPCVGRRPGQPYIGTLADGAAAGGHHRRLNPKRCGRQAV